MDILIRLVQSVLETQNALLVVTVLLCLPMPIVVWRAPELTLRYFASTMTMLLSEKARERFRDMFQALEAESGKGKTDDSEAGSQ